MPKRADRLPPPSPRLADALPGQRVRLEVLVIGGKGYLGGTRVEVAGREYALPDDTEVTKVE